MCRLPVCLRRTFAAPAWVGACSDIGRKPLRFAGTGLERCQPLLPSGTGAFERRRSSRAVLRRLQRGARHRRGRRCGSGSGSRADAPGAPADAASRRARCPASIASRSLSAVARESPSIPATASSSEVAPRITEIGSGSPWTYRSRRSAATRFWDAASERRTISACRSRALLGAGELRRALLEARQVGLRAREGRFGRVQLEQRRRLRSAERVCLRLQCRGCLCNPARWCRAGDQNADGQRPHRAAATFESAVPQERDRSKIAPVNVERKPQFAGILSSCRLQTSSGAARGFCLGRVSPVLACLSTIEPAYE